MGDRSVIVAGGGIAGLAVASALQRADYDVTVVEQFPQLTATGGGLALAPNGLRALQQIGLAEKVIPIGNPLSRFEHRNPSGRVLARWPWSVDGHCPRAMWRGDLVGALAEGLGRAEARVGVRVASVEQDDTSVTAVLADGTELSASILVGADGADSAIRQALGGPVPERAFSTLRGLAEATVEDGVFAMSYGRGATFGYVPVAPGRIIMWANLRDGRGTEPGGRRAALLERFAGWHDPIPGLIESWAEDEISHVEAQQVREPFWGRGRVTLIGDAAHPMSPAFGQGASMALEDAAVLGRCLRGAADPIAALHVFQEARTARVRGVLRRAAVGAKIWCTDGRLAPRARDIGLMTTPRAIPVKAASRTWLSDF